MNLFSCTVMLGGDINQQVSDKIVTVPEIALLRYLHGDTSVFNIVPLRRHPQNQAEIGMLEGLEVHERDRLRRLYGMNNDEGKLVVDIVFPGATNKLPTQLAEIGLDPGTQAKTLREKAEAMLKAAEALELEEKGEDQPIEPVAQKKKQA